jgi:Xaa-Pro dipeptidase
MAKREADEEMRAAKLLDAQQKATELFEAVRGWTFGKHHCGHLVGEFPHENFGGERMASLITGANTLPLRRRDPSGRIAHWILEVHLVDHSRQIGGFYEELLTV